MNDKKGHNIVKDSLTHKPDGVSFYKRLASVQLLNHSNSHYGHCQCGCRYSFCDIFQT